MITKWILAIAYDDGVYDDCATTVAVEDSQERAEQRRIRFFQHLAEKGVELNPGRPWVVTDRQYEDEAAVTAATEKALWNWNSVESELKWIVMLREFRAKEDARAAEEMEHDRGVEAAERECRRIDAAKNAAVTAVKAGHTN